MPTPGENETQQEFIKRCIPMVIEDGTASDNEQAVAVCYSMWEQSQAEGSEGKVNYIRAFCIRGEEETAAGSPIRFIASTEGIKRDGKDLKAEDWRLDNFRANPVVLWVHDYTGQHPPIGRAMVDFEGRKLIADVLFDQQDEFARQVESKYRRGFLSAVSVGWQDVIEGKRTYHDLMDISAVPVPSDPQALKLQELRALLDELETETREDYPWDECIADQMEQYGDMETAEKVCGMIKAKYSSAWKSDPERVLDEIEKELDLKPRKGRVGLSDADVWEGVASAMLALYRPGAAMEDEMRHGIWVALERVYRRLGKTAPEWCTQEELDALGEDEIRGLFLSDEYQRVGAVLSKRNQDDLKEAIALIRGVLARAEKEEPELGPSPQDTERAYLLDIQNRLNLLGV